MPKIQTKRKGDMTLFNDRAWDFWTMWQLRSYLRVNQSRREPKSEKIDFIFKREIKKSFKST